MNKGHLIVSLMIIAIVILDYFFGKNKLYRLLCETWHTIREEWHRLLVLVFIAAWMYLKYVGSNYKDEHAFHVSLEFLGVLILFLIVEHTIKKLNSGISDPSSLPINDFISEVAKTNGELILFDTVLETIMLDDNYATKLKIALKTALKASNSDFSARILILSVESPYAIERAKQRGISEDQYKKKIVNVRNRLLHMKTEIEDEIDDSSGKIRIHEYKSSPPFAMYSLDGKAYVSFFPKNMKTTNSRQLFIPNDTELAKEIFRFFYSKFDAMWLEESTEICH